jgi:hypothetical protein
MFSKIPIALIKTTIDVDPAEINGSGSPVGGMSPVTTATFSIVWTPIIAVMPLAR